MKKLIFPILAIFVFTLIIACGSADKANEKAQQEIQTMDSISAEMEQTIQNLEQKTEEVEKEIDDILDDLE